MGLGFANPTLGCLADKYSLSKFSTCGIFIISGVILYQFCYVQSSLFSPVDVALCCGTGLTLRTEAIGAAVKGWPLGIFGLV